MRAWKGWTTLAWGLVALWCTSPVSDSAEARWHSEPTHPPVQQDMASAVAPAPLGKAIAAQPEASPQSLTFGVAFSSGGHQVRAVDAQGVVYGIRSGADRELWVSSDQARTWSLRFTHPGGNFGQMKVLRDGTLLAAVMISGQWTLQRSTDHGSTWTQVLSLGKFRMLQPNNIVELSGTVFFGEYQTHALESPIRLWASTDRGATWKVRHTFQGRRHMHSLVADGARGTLWALMGDRYGGLLRSKDGGHSWTPIIEGAMGVAVDGVVTGEGLLFGLDVLYLPYRPAVMLLKNDDSLVELAPLPGPSYSVKHLSGGGYLLGVTREVGGDVYAADDVSARLFGSVDGKRWMELAAFPRRFDTSYARADVRWQLPNGEVLLELENVLALPGAGNGYLVLKPELR